MPTLLALLLFLTTWSRARAEDGGLPLLEVHEPDSHLAAAGWVRAQVREAFDAELARYDAYLAVHPEDVATALLRCRFLDQLASYEEDWTGLQESVMERQQSCLDDLSAQFPSDPEVALYRVESAYGPARIALAGELLEDADRWTGVQRARVRKLLAEALEPEQPARALSVARLASAEAPYVDVALVLARAAVARRDKAGAIAILTERLADTTPPDALPEKAELLVALGAYEQALRALELHTLDPTRAPDHALRARCLEGLGRIEEARAEYAQLDRSFMPLVERERIFDFQLRHGTPEDAAAAYAELDGTAADTFGGQRLRLLWHHPSAVLRARDGGRFLALLLLLAGAFGLPFLAALPVHYAGLLRKERGGAPGLADTPWTLRRTAGLLGGLLVLDLLLTWLFAPSELNTRLNDFTAPRPSDSDLASYFLAHSLVVLAAMFVAVRPAQIASLLQVDRPWRELRAELRRSAGVLVLVAIGNRVLERLFTRHGEVAAGLIAEMPSTEAMLRAVAVEDGAPALLFCTVVSAPVAEELLFRYVLSDSLQRHLTWKWAVGLQALAFALVHDNYAFMPTLFCLGLLAARLRRRSGSMAPPMLLHAGWNALASLVILQRAG